MIDSSPQPGGKLIKEMNEMTATMTPAELATELSSDSKTVRKYLRSITPRDEQPGKGSRWAVPANKGQLSTLRKGFTKWTAEQAEERAARAAKAAEEATAAAAEVDETE